MGLEDAFEVATEFRFDVGQALINTNALQNSVQQLSNTASGALQSLDYLAGGLVARLGFGSGGLLSILSQSVKISEAWNMEALNFANNISSNIRVLAGDIHTFNDRLKTSQMLMSKVSDTAISVGLDTTELAHLSQLLATPLAMHGKLGTNYAGAISMAKNSMIASEAVGLNPAYSGEMLSRAITDHMAIHGALFARLVNTQAFKSMHVATQGQLINMNTDRKIDLLTTALQQLAGDAGFVAERLNHLSVQFTILKDQIQVILKPIGDAIVVPLRMMMQGLNRYLLMHGKEIGNAISGFIGSVFDDPKKLLIGLLQLRRLGGDVKKAAHLTELYTTFTFLTFILGKIGITFSGGLLLRGFKALLSGAMTLLRLIPIGGILSGAFTLLRSALAAVLPTFSVFLFFFQVFSRALAIAHIADVVRVTTLMPKLMELFVRVKTAIGNILMPINEGIDALARFIAPLFEASAWLNIVVPVFEAFVDLLEVMGKAVLYLMAGLEGLITVVIGFVDDLVHLKNPFMNMKDNFNTGYQDYLTRHKDRMGGNPESVTQNQVTNIGKIEARFDFREQMEPDRIAFAVTDHIKKLATNPLQGRGNSFGKAFTGSLAIAGNR